MRTWKIGSVKVTQVIEFPVVPSDLDGLVEQATPEAVAQIDWLHPDYANEQHQLEWSVHSYVVDTGSANGTKHNGLRVPPRAKVAILDGDTLVFGRCVFQWMSARSLYERVLTFAG